MAIELTMPQLGESVTEGTVGAWLKKEGDLVRRDEPLVEVITDKVNAEVPSPVEGILVKILVPAGETVPVGQPIAVIEAPGVGTGNGTGASQPLPVREHPVATGAPGTAGPEPASGDGAGRVPAAAFHLRDGTMAAGGEGAGEEGGAPRRYSPVVRRLAAEHGIDLGTIQGTGLAGRVTKKDVLAYLARREEGTGRRSPVVVEAPPAWEVIEPDAMRRTIADRMGQSWREIPHAWAMIEADVTGLVRLRERVKDEFQRREGIPLTFVPFWIKAVVQTLREVPRLNAVWHEGKILVHKHINVGLAVGLEDGLVVPVIRDADRHTIVSLAREVHRLVEKARAGKLSVEDVQGGTITLNNTGALGVTLSKSIVNPPQTAICNMDAIVKRPVVVGDAIAIRSMVNLTISFDHRVVDGVPVGRFLQKLRARMEAYGEDTSLY